MKMLRKQNDSTVSTGESHRMMGVGGDMALLEVHSHRHCFERVKLQVVVTAPGHQVVNLPPVGRLVAARDESDEGGVVHELQEFDGLVTGGTADRVREKSRGERTQLWGDSVLMVRGSETCFPSLTRCLLQYQTGSL